MPNSFGGPKNKQLVIPSFNIKKILSSTQKIIIGAASGGSVTAILIILVTI